MNPFADFAEGLPSSSLHFVGDSARSYRTTSYDFFAQDSFKIKPNLVFNYGLRYEYNTVLHDATGRATTFRPDRFSQYLSPTADQTDLTVLEKSGMITENQGGLYRSFRKKFCTAHWAGMEHRQAAENSSTRRLRNFLRHGHGADSGKCCAEPSIYAGLF